MLWDLGYHGAWDVQCVKVLVRTTGLRLIPTLWVTDCVVIVGALDV